MDLYFAPLACSMATRIALYEAGIECRYLQVDTRAKRLADGGDFFAINPMGQVPVLRTADGELLTENAVILQYVADRKPEAGLAPPSGAERYRLQQWLSFIATELHKVVFIPLLDRNGNDGARAFAREKAERPFARLDAHLGGQEHLLGRFTVADAYLATVLNWAKFSGLDLARFPAVKSYAARLRQRPSIARALSEELALYTEQQARKGAA